ncbi:uncharacterized protein BDR25DRAFT_371019, partial [Lindgomyces ingoldianus]
RKWVWLPQRSNKEHPPKIRPQYYSVLHPGPHHKVGLNRHLNAERDMSGTQSILNPRERLGGESDRRLRDRALSNPSKQTNQWRGERGDMLTRAQRFQKSPAMLQSCEEAQPGEGECALDSARIGKCDPKKRSRRNLSRLLGSYGAWSGVGRSSLSTLEYFGQAIQEQP